MRSTKLWASLALMAAVYLYNGTPSWSEFQARLHVNRWTTAMSAWFWPKDTKLVSDERAQAIAATRDRIRKLKYEHSDIQRKIAADTATLTRAHGTWTSASSGCGLQDNEPAGILRAANRIVLRRADQKTNKLSAAIQEEQRELRDEIILAAAEVLGELDSDSPATNIATTGPQPTEASVLAR
jgi:hypothetical protein